ncbi:MAG: hypothetical protein L6Q99_06385 [Planctomycetes bacterium]|nr:hypothetical protein [Planctomycetota bacterium]
MRTQLLAVVVLFASCSALVAADSSVGRVTPASSSGAAQRSGGLAERLKTPDQPWTIDLRGGNAKLIDLVASFEAATGERVAFSQFARGRLESAIVGLTTNATIAPDQVYSWFEALVAREGFRLYVATHTEPRMLVLVSRLNNNDLPGTPYPVSSSDLAALDRHPALVVQTTVDVAPLDARAMMNSLRPTVQGDTSSFITAPSESSVVLTASGAEVAVLLRLLEEARKHELTRLKNQPPPEAQPAPAAQR